MEEIKKIEGKIKDWENWLNARKPLYYNLLKDNSVGFQFSEGFYIDFGNLEEIKIHMDVNWFLEKGFTETQIDWAIQHEIRHFRDLAEDSVGLLETFKQSRENGRKFAKKVQEKWEETLQKEISAIRSDISISNEEKEKKIRQREKFLENIKKQRPIFKNNKSGETLNQIESEYAKIFSTFNNCIDDVWVNATIPLTAKRFEKTKFKPTNSRKLEPHQEIEKLYREILFPDIKKIINQDGGVTEEKTEWTKLSRHRQFMYKVLRDFMLPNEPMQVCEEVQRAYDSVLKDKNGHEIKIAKEGINVSRFLDFFILPKKDTTLTVSTKRHQQIQEKLLPTFWKLLEKDIENWEPEFQEEKDEKGEEGKGNEGEKGESGGEEGKGNEGEKGESGGEEGKGNEGEKGESGGEETENDTDPTQNHTEGKKGGKGESKSGTKLTPHSGEIDKASENEIDQVDPESMEGFTKKFADKKEEERKEEAKKAQMSAKERTEYEKVKEKERDRKEWAEQTVKNDKEKKAGIDKKNPPKNEEVDPVEDPVNEKVFTVEELVKNAADFDEIESNVGGSLQEMSTFWEQLIGTSMQYRRQESAPHFKSGDLSIDEFIRQFPEIQKGVSQGEPPPRIFTRFENEINMVRQPEEIRVTFIGDMSGSMNHPIKINVLKKAFVLATKSLYDFKLQIAEHNRNAKDKERIKLKVTSNAYTYGSTSLKVKDYENEEEDGLTGIIKAFSHLKTFLGGTNNSITLGKINKEITKEDEGRMKSGKLIHIVIDLTDGGTNEGFINTSRQGVLDLINKGADYRAIQVGNPERVEVQAYDATTNSFGIDEFEGSIREKIEKQGVGPNGKVNFGAKLGVDYEKLYKVMVENFQSIFGGIRLY